jgi:outer membrane protein TolC
LRAMYVKKLTAAAVVVLVLGALAAAGFLSYPRLAARQNEGTALAPEKPQTAAKAEDRLPSLLKERVEVAKQWVADRTAEYEAGRGTLFILLDTSRQLLQAELEASDKKADQLAALDAYLKRAKHLEELNKQRYDEGRLSRADMSQSTYYRLEAEILLERAKAK